MPSAPPYCGLRQHSWVVQFAMMDRPAPARPGSIAQRLARSSRALQTAWLAVLTLVLTGRYVWVYRHHPLGPHNDRPAADWFGWADQAAYYLDAHGWATGNLDPSQHLYPSGYGLLGAAFVWLTPADPFVVPNLLCWAASLWLFAALGVRLAGRLPGAWAVSGTIFFLVTVPDRHAFYSWEVPWTSTPSAVLVFASLLLTIRYAEERRRGLGLAACLLAGLIVLFRPTDALILMPATAIGLGTTLRPRREGWPATGYAMIAAGCAFAVGPMLLLVTHVATHGWTLGRYFEASRLIGFEWRLLPLRWVTLLLSPKPLYPQGDGFAEVYWFVLPGLAGIFVAILADRGRRLHHLVVGGGAIVFLCLYLCYRDLQVSGLFLFQNQHYLKWTVPVFGLYALALPYFLIVRRQLLASMAALACVGLLSCWRAELVVVSAQPAATVLADGQGVDVPNDLSGVDLRGMISSACISAGTRLRLQGALSSRAPILSWYPSRSGSWPYPCARCQPATPYSAWSPRSGLIRSRSC